MTAAARAAMAHGVTIWANPSSPHAEGRAARAALEEARAAALRGEVPVGAVVVRDGAVLARAGNRTRELADPTAHAEMLAIREACRVTGSERLTGCDLYVTLEPCPMCASLITQSRIREVHVALHEVQSGALGTVLDLTHDPLNHIRLNVHWSYDERAQGLLDEFFVGKKKKPVR